ncbi:MAG: hypothetical protein F6K19_11150 [Cyanothece sp. SIO1E1]|nr:hypothetical protein [Cyanothece sp. SIO1E1]
MGLSLSVGEFWRSYNWQGRTPVSLPNPDEAGGETLLPSPLTGLALPVNQFFQAIPWDGKAAGVELISLNAAKAILATAAPDSAADKAPVSELCLSVSQFFDRYAWLGKPSIPPAQLLEQAAAPESNILRSRTSTPEVPIQGATEVELIESR